MFAELLADDTLFAGGSLVVIILIVLILFLIFRGR